MEEEKPIDSQPTKTAEEPEAKEPEKEKEKEKADDDGEKSPTEGIPSSNSWWGLSTSAMQKMSSVVNAAKEKSDEVYGFVSKDLGEVSVQATAAVGATATTLKKTLEEFDDKTDELADKAVESMTKSMSGFWNSASGYAKNLFLQEDTEAEAILVRDKGPVLLDRLQAQLYSLASDPQTFLTDPHSDESAQWSEYKCDLEKRQGEIEDLMINNNYIRQNYKELVPDKVPHKEFWKRYFFKVHLLELQEQKRQALKKRAEQTRYDSDSDINWDDVEDLAGDEKVNSPKKTNTKPAVVEEDIPEDLQDKLLSDYEEELKGKKRDSLKEELDASNRVSPEKDSTNSDDWEKLSNDASSSK